jgi:hypothetical protein
MAALTTNAMRQRSAPEAGSAVAGRAGVDGAGFNWAGDGPGSGWTQAYQEDGIRRAIEVCSARRGLGTSCRRHFSQVFRRSASVAGDGAAFFIFPLAIMVSYLTISLLTLFTG